MKIRLHENNWTVFIDDVDFKSITQDEVNQISKLIAENTCVVIKNQPLTVAEELRVIKMFKTPEPLFRTSDSHFIHCAADINVDPEGIICRVSGELDDHGKPGIAGYVDEMRWHCNHPYKVDRKPIVWLYGVRGTLGSRTTWNNNILTWQDLDNDTKNQLKDLKFIARQGMSHNERLDGEDGSLSGKPVFNYEAPLVYTNIAGKTGLYFPFLQIHSFVGMTPEESQKIIKPLAEFTVQEKYCYHHDWEDGDIVISEQWLGIHKRWKFEGIANRLLHRAVMDFPDNLY